MKIYLLRQDRTVEKEFELKQPVTRLGREVDNDIHLLVPGISRYHCEFEFDGFEWRVRDLGSTNGTMVNTLPIGEPRVLRGGDLVEVGDQMIRFGDPMTMTSVQTEIRQISIFDLPADKRNHGKASTSGGKVIFPAEEEIEAATDTVIEAPAPEPTSQATPPPEKETKSDVSATHNVIAATGPAGEYQVTETVKTSVPLYDMKATTSGPVGQAKIIINLPGQTQGNNGGIVFEPLAEEPLPEIAPVIEHKTIIPPPVAPLPHVLTPAPETIKGVVPETPPLVVGVTPEAPPSSPAPAAESVPPSEPHGHHVDFKLFDKMPLFGGKHTETKNEEEAKTPRRKISNLLFYTLVVCSAVIFVSVFVMLQKKPAATSTTVAKAKEPEVPLLLVYEKKIISRDNIFVFTMTMEGSSVKLSLDDLRSQRHYLREDAKVKPELVAELLSDIKSTDFMELPPQPSGSPRDGIDEYRRLTVGYDKLLKTVVIDNNSPPISFEKIERSINDFAEDYGLQTIALTPEELKREAEIAFNKAEELFLNRDADPQNLKKALKRYQLTIDYLDQFAPKPRQWTLARKRLAESKEIIDKKLQDLRFDYQRQYRLQEYDEMLKTTDRILPLLDPNSKEYEKYRAIRIKLEAKLRKDK